MSNKQALYPGVREDANCAFCYKRMGCTERTRPCLAFDFEPGIGPSGADCNVCERQAVCTEYKRPCLLFLDKRPREAENDGARDASTAFLKRFNARRG
jgi:hypothetical protein